MKRILFTLAVTTFIASSIFTGCNSPTQKTENAEENVQETKVPVLNNESDLYLTQKDSLSTFQQFKANYEKQINANEKRVAEIKMSFADANKETKAIYNKKLAGLEKRNSDLKTKLAEYKDDGAGNWQIFKIEFKSDMDDLGKAFSDFTVSNT
jgi:hypothetical protein